MKKIITKSVIAAFALFAVAGTANATIVDNGAYQVGDLPPSGIPNIASDDGFFKYHLRGNGSKKMKYKAKGDFVLNMGSGSYLIKDARIKVKGKIKKDGTLRRKKDGTLKGGKSFIEGIDPFSPGERTTLVTFQSNGDFSFLWDADGEDVFGMSITNIDCPLWDFCTNTETFYAIGEFGTNPARIKAKSGVLGVTTIPVPAAVWLFGSGLLGLVGVARKRRHTI